MTEEPDITVFHARPGDLAAFLDPPHVPTWTGGDSTRSAANVALRLVAAKTLGIPPANLVFSRNRYGKPRVSTRPNDRSPLHFSLSHTGRLFMLAISLHTEVGVDVEEIRRRRRFAEIASFAFAPEEQAEFSALYAEEEAEVFTAVWTRKEAVVKAVGGSGAELLDRFLVPVDALMHTTFQVRLDAGADAELVTVRDLPVDGLHRAAVAWRSSARRRVAFRRLRKTDLAPVE